MTKNLSEEVMLNALGRLDEKLATPIKLIVGGGGAMILAFQLPLGTSDIDAIPTGIQISELDPLVKEVAKELNLPPDWLNPYYSIFTHVLPQGYGARLEKIGEFKHLEVLALSKEDLLLMKCFAGRQKDVSHIKALIKIGAKIEPVEAQLEVLKKKNIPGATNALDFLDDILGQIEV